ncbi:MAG TPA: DUF2017 family protein [Mycobacteriales bacterium]|jgi:hypothetical protein|nr:DUF2017 family protein [Mycobacteriales bacterium]
MPRWIFAQPFRRTAAGVEARLGAGEAQLLVQLCRDLADRLGEVDDRAPVGAGPLGRLFPDGYGDAERSAELRSLIQDDLRDAKIAAARTVVETLSDLPPSRRVTLTDDEVEQWLTALNDLRLFIGTQLGVTDDGEVVVADEDGVSATAHDVFQVLSWLQSALVDVLLG